MHRLLLIGVSVMMVSCSDSGSVTPDAAVGDTGTDVGGSDLAADAQGPVTVTITATVYDLDPSKLLVDPTSTPLSGATVALDPPAGARAEQTTDAAGKAVFKDVTFAAGARASLTAHKDGYNIYSEVGLDSGKTEVKLYLYRLSTDLVEVSGKLLNLDPKANAAFVSAVLGGIYTGLSSGYKVQVNKSAPFKLVGAQLLTTSKPSDRETDYTFFGWTELDHAGVSAPATVDLDFGKSPLTPTKVKGTLTLPADPKSLLVTASRPMVRVSSEASNGRGLLGYVSKTTVDQPGGKVSFEAEYVTPAGHAKLLTTYILWVGAGMSSELLGSGAPKEGQTISGFLELPAVTSPKDHTTAAPLHDPVRWTNPNALTPEHAMVNLYKEEDGPFIWKVVGPGSAAELTIPKPPSGAKLSTIFGAGPIPAQVVFCHEADWKRLTCGRWAGSRYFKLNLQ